MSRKPKNLLLLAAGAVFGLVLSLATGVLAQKDAPQETLPYAEARLLAEVLERVREEYVEPVDDSVLIESAVRGMVMDLDQHSQYLNCNEYEEVRISTTGNYSGVGLEVHMQDGQVHVVSAIDGTPAQRAGLRFGDIILSINGVDLTDTNYAEAANLMRGKAGTPVELTVSRPNEAEPIDFRLVRNNVQVQSVRHQLLDGDIGYIRISHFSETTWKDTRKAVRRLRREAREDLQGVILDLRNNPGGVLDAAVDISDGFLDGGLIVSASGRGPDASFSHMAREGDILDGVRMAVLVNGGSASSSEILAGALGDNDRAVIVGTQTFGKGSVQTVMPLSSCRAIKLTTSLYFTPDGTSIQGTGITPDLEIERNEALDALAGITAHQTDPGAVLLQSDSQLRAAVDALTDGRIVQSKAPQ
ncbi:MAG: S41 family peptidase [Gammaproteobacteria bacterium]|nr:S41 family peptidase [Gammaproteobacteria bacterium]